MKKIISALLVLTLVFALAACAKKAETVDYSGVYDVVRIETDGTTATEEDLQALRDLGFDAVVSFAEDGTGIMSIAENDSEFTYDAAAGIMHVGEGESKMEFNEAGQLVITDDSGVMYLEKRTEEE